MEFHNRLVFNSRKAQPQVALLWLGAMVLFILSLAPVFMLPFDSQIPLEYVFYAVIDQSVTVTAICIYIYCRRRQIRMMSIALESTYAASLRRNMFIFLIIVLIIVHAVYGRLESLLGGITREMLLDEYYVNRVLLVLMPMTVAAFAFSLIIRQGIFLRLILLVGFFSVVLVNLSRTEILLVVFFCTTFVLVAGRLKFGLKKSAVVLAFVAVVIGFAAGMTVLQGRADSLGAGAVLGFESLFRYRSFSFFLAERAIEVSSSGVDKLLFPFFGFLVERPFWSLGWVNQPVSSGGSIFVSQFVRLGPSSAFNANVLYPWWAWYYGAFGWAGIFIKVVWVCLLLHGLLRFELYLTFLFFLSAMLFTAYIRHPFLNHNSVYFFIGLLLLDGLLRSRIVLSAPKGKSRMTQRLDVS